VPETVRDQTISFTYNDISELETILIDHEGAVAAIVMEPVGVTEPNKGYLQAVRELADQMNVVLIFDECWTGFRIHRQGSYGIYGVSPDLACFGKALGNGVPISAIVGRSDIMSVFEDIFFSFTFGGDGLGIAAALAVLDVLEKEPVLEHVDNIGSRLIQGLQQLISTHDLDNHVSLTGYPARHFIGFSVDGKNDLKAKSYFQQEAIKRGILATAWHAPSYSHKEQDVLQTLDVYNDVLKNLKVAIDNEILSEVLEGEEVRPVFRKP
jgi:glutamate-1-semialdehyde aminotransferase